MRRPSLNHVFRLVWSSTQGCLVPVAENQPAKGKSSKKSVVGATAALALGVLAAGDGMASDSIMDGFGDAGYLVGTGIGDNSGNIVSIGDADTNTVYTNYFTEGGAGSGGGAGLGGVFFVNEGANLTLNNVSFLSNVVKGGEGGSLPAQKAGDIFVNLAPTSLELISIDTKLAAPEITKDVNGNYSFSAVKVSTGTDLFNTGSSIVFDDLNASATVDSKTNDTITLGSPVSIASNAIVSASAAVTNGNDVTTAGYAIDSQNTNKINFIQDADTALSQNILDNIALGGQVFLGTTKGIITEVGYGDGGKITSITLDSAISGSGSLDIINVTEFSTKQFNVTDNTVNITGSLTGFTAGMKLYDDNNNLLTTVSSVSPDGKTLTVANGASLANVDSFTAKASPVVADNQIKLSVARDDFKVGSTVYVPDTNFTATITAYDKTTGLVTFNNDVPTSVTDKLNLGNSIVLALKNVVSASGNTLQVVDNGQKFETGMVLSGTGVEGLVVTNVVDNGSTITLTLDDSITDGSTVSQVSAASPLSKGGSMNGIEQTADASGNGRNGFDATPVTAFFNSGEGGEGTRGYSGASGDGGAGSDGGNGGNGSNGLPVNPMALAELNDATGDFIDSAGELAGAIAPDGFPPTPDYADIPFAVLDLAAKSVKLGTAIFDVVQWGIELNRGTKGLGGDGGEGGEGGSGDTFYGGGAGGAGGNGGDGALAHSDGGMGGDGGRGGDGGFGAGGGAGGAGGIAGATGAADDGNAGDGGYGGFGAGDGSNGNGLYGEGGSGFGGAVFVRNGGTLTITGNSLFENNTALAGSSNNNGEAGESAGSDLFVMKGADVLLSPGQGKTITFRGSIADDSASSYEGAPYASGAGATIRIGGGGLVQFEGENTYSGLTRIEGATLEANLGEGVNNDSRIHFVGVGISGDSDTATLDPHINAGTLLTGGSIVRRVGTLPGQVSWDGAGGFSATDENLIINFGAISSTQGQTLKWNTSSISDDSTMVFGSEFGKGYVAVLNNIDMNNSIGHMVVYDNLESENDFALLTGSLTNGGLQVGANRYNGKLHLTGQSSLSSLAIDSGVVSTQGANGTSDAGRLMNNTNGGTLIMTGGRLETWSDEKFTSITVGDEAEYVAVAGLTSNDITNEGEITLQGASNTGNITNKSDAILNIASNLTVTGTLTNEAVGVINQAGNVVVSSTVTNNGTLNVTGKRSMQTTGLNGSGSIVLALNDDDELTLNQSGDSTFNGVVSGAGDLIKTGAGKLTLTAAQTFTGGLSVSGGTFETSSSATLADLLDVTVNNGATFIAGVADTVKSYNINQGGTATFNSNQATTGSISNAGTLNATGTVTAGTDITNTNTFGVSGAVQATEGSVSNSGTMNLGSTLVAGTDISNAANSTMTIENNVTSGNDISNAGTFTATNGAVQATDGSVSNSGTMTVGDTLVAGTDISNAANSTMTIENNVTAGNSISNAGTFTATNGAVQATDGSVSNSGSMTVGNTLVAGTDISNAANSIMTIENNVTAGNSISNAGTFTATNGAVEATEGSVSNSGTMTVGTTLVAGTDISNAANSTMTIENNVTAGNSISNAGTFTATNGVVEATDGSVSNSGSMTVGNTLVAGTDISNAANSTMTIASHVTAGSSISNAGTFTATNGAVEATEGSVSNSGTMTVGTTLVAGTDISNAANSTMTIASHVTAGNDISNAGTMTVGGNMTATNGGLENNGTLNLTANSSTLNLATGLSGTNSNAAINMANPVSLVQAGDTNYAGKIQGNGALTLNGSGTLTLSGVAGSLDLDGGVVINNGTLALDGAGILADSLDVTVNKTGQTEGTLALISGDQSIESLAGEGKIDLGTGGNKLNVATGGSFTGTVVGDGTLNIEGGTFNVNSNVTSTTGTFDVNAGANTTVDEGATIAFPVINVLANTNGNGRLDVAGTAEATSVNVETDARLHLGNNNGTVAGTITAQTTNVAGTLSGVGSVSGLTVMQSGSFLRPGNSPGVVNFDQLVLDGLSTTVMEIEGNGVAGAADGFDQIVANSLAIQTGAKIEIANSNTFELAMGQTRQVFVVPTGKTTGYFAEATNTGFANEVALNLATGNVVGLGSTGYAGLAAVARNSNQQAMLNDVKVNDVGGVAQFYGGRLVDRLAATAGAGGNTDAVFALASPESYAALTDYSRQSALSTMVPLAHDMKSKDLNVAMRTSYQNMKTNNASEFAAYNTRSNWTEVQVDKGYQGGALSLAVGMDNGTAKSNTMNGSATGYMVNAGISHAIPAVQGLNVTGRLGYTSHRFDTSRTTMTGASTSDTNTHSYLASLGLNYGKDLGKVRLNTSLDVISYSTNVDAFTEKNAADSLDALAVKKQSVSDIATKLSVGLSSPVTEKLTLAADLGYLYIGGDSRMPVKANVASESTQFAVSTPGLDNHIYSLGVAGSYKLTEQSKVNLGIRGVQDQDAQFNLMYQQSF